MVTPDGSNLLDKAASFAIPTDVRDALASTPPDPEPGQIWRVATRGTTALVLLTAVRPRFVTVALFAGAAGTAGTIELPSSISSLQSSFRLWADLRGDVATRFLDRLIGRMTSPDNVEQQIATVDVSAVPIVSPAQSAYLERAEAAATLEVLSEPPHQIGGDGTLAEKLRDVAFDYVAELVDGGSPRALGILRGDLPINFDEAKRLAPAASLPPETLLEANPAPPNDLVNLLEMPRWRPNIIELAERRAIDEDSARTVATYDTFALAARVTGKTTTSMWEEKLAQYFSAVSGE